MNIVDFRPEHLTKIRVQHKQTDFEQSLQYGRELAVAGEAWTGLEGDEVLFCAGKVRQWQGRYVLWAVLSREARKYMTQITRAVKRGMMLLDENCRYEAYVQSDFIQGHRWARMVGMEWHHHEEKFLPGRIDADIYVRFT